MQLFFRVIGRQQAGHEYTWRSSQRLPKAATGNLVCQLTPPLDALIFISLFTASATAQRMLVNLDFPAVSRENTEPALVSGEILRRFLFCPQVPGQ